MIAYVVATDGRKLAALVGTARPLGAEVTVVAVGPRALADAAAAAGADAVTWIETAAETPAEAYAGAVAGVLAAAAPRAVLANPTPAARALLGAAAAAMDAVVVTGVTALALEGDAVVVERSDLGGRVVETLAADAPVAGLFGGPDAPSPAGTTPAPIHQLAAPAAADLRLEKAEPVVEADGVVGADRVVAVGRGLKSRADLALVDELADVLGAAVGCSMPIADDFGWVPKERYIGRSGQHIAPRLYLAIGISGAPQHLDGVREAKTVIAINDDAEAPVFRRADYGVVGDLYEVVPALRAALVEGQSQNQGRGDDHG